MRVLAATALALVGCVGDIVPIKLPGPVFVTEAGNTPGAMHRVRSGVQGPLAVGGWADPILLERRDSGWIPLLVSPDWRGAMRDVSAAEEMIFVVGGAGQVGAGDRSGIELIASGTEMELHAVFARGAEDVFLAGVEGLLHYDGEEVAPIETASVAPSQRFFALWGTGGTIVVAGAAGTALMISGDSVQPTETGTVATLRSVHGRSRTEIYAVGGDDRGAVVRWDGQRWNDIALASMPRLHAVFAGPSGVWVSGDAGYLARWDGFRWIEIGTGSSAPLNGALEQDGDLFVTGGNILDPTALGFVARYGE